MTTFSRGLNLHDFVCIHDSLCPNLFSGFSVNKTVAAGLRRLADYWWEETQTIFSDLERRDVVLYGDIVGYLYNHQTEVSLGVCCKMPEKMSTCLPLINQVLSDSELRYRLDGRKVHCRLLVEIPEDVPVYSLNSEQWINTPRQRNFSFSIAELCESFAAYRRQANQFAQSLPKYENTLLVPDSCRRLESFLQQLEQNALAARRQEPDHEYSLAYLLWRTLLQTGTIGFLTQYIAASYNYSISEGRY